MGILRSVLAAVETILVEQSYTRAKENFTLDQVPRTKSHKAYTFGPASIRPSYVASNCVDYLNTVASLLIMWKVHGSHNADGTQAEGYLDALDEFEGLEDALVRDQLRANDEHIAFGDTALEPWFSEGEGQDYLLITIPLVFDVARDMDD